MIIDSSGNNHIITRCGDKRLRNLMSGRMFMGAAGGGDFHSEAINCSGSRTYLANTSLNTIGVENVFTISVWFRRTSEQWPTTAYLFKMRPAGQHSRVSIVGQSSSNISTVLYDSSAAEFKNYITDNSPISAATIYQFVITWDGTDLLFFLNGASQSLTKSLDNSGTMGTDTRKVYIGYDEPVDINTEISSVCMWDTDLSASAILATYGDGAGYQLDLRKTQGNYTETANLKHQWLLGKNSADIGADYVPSGSIDVDTNASNITSSDIVTFSPVEFTSPHTKAVDFDGSTEYLANTTYQTLGFGDVFTIGIWFNVDSASGTNSIAVLNGNGNNSRITIQVMDLASDQRFRVELFDSGGTSIKTWAKNGMYSLSTNTHVFITWTGNTTLNAYFDGGAAVTGWSKAIDTTGTMADDARRIWIGADSAAGALFTGNIAEFAIWNVSLDSNNRTAIYNGAGGSATGFKDDLRNDQGNYDQSSALVHQWKLGNDGTADAKIGFDYVSSGGANLSDNQVNVTTSDIVTF